jgi:hypothetical protein
MNIPSFYRSSMADGRKPKRSATSEPIDITLLASILGREQAEAFLAALLGSCTSTAATTTLRDRSVSEFAQLTSVLSLMIAESGQVH